MGKDPAFLFYPNDWLGGTMGMSFESKGAYIELLMLQFNRGHMSIDMIAQTLGQNYGQLWGQIKDKFERDKNGKYFNRRLEEEKLKRSKYVKSRNNNRKGKNQYTKKRQQELAHMSTHMENEDENSNKINNDFAILEIYNRFIEEINNDKHSTAIDAMYMNLKVKKGSLGKLLEKYKGQLLIDNVLHENTLEMRKHFNNWLNVQERFGKLDEYKTKRKVAL